MWPSRWNRVVASRHRFVRAFLPLAACHGRSVSAMEIDVVLPCLNEAGALPWLLSRMPSGYRPIVADNGSTDGSPVIAADHGATVVHVPQRGYGAACHAGLDAAKHDVVCFMDADGSLDTTFGTGGTTTVAFTRCKSFSGSRTIFPRGASFLESRYNAASCPKFPALISSSNFAS